MLSCATDIVGGEPRTGDLGSERGVLSFRGVEAEGAGNEIIDAVMIHGAEHVQLVALEAGRRETKQRFRTCDGPRIVVWQWQLYVMGMVFLCTDFITLA